MSRVFCAIVLLIDLIILLPELILCAMFSHKFSLFSFFHVVTYAVFMCVVYILYFSFSTLWWIKLIIIHYPACRKYYKISSFNGTHHRTIEHCDTFEN